jgi:hypothetical protein
MTGKNLAKICITGVLAICFLLQVELAGGDDRIDRQAIEKCNVPMTIKLYFSTVPMLNEYTVLNVEIKVFRDAPNTRIEIELPEEGFRRISGNAQLMENLPSGSTTVYQLEVIPTALGQYKISASANSEAPGYTFGKKEELYVNIGEESSQLSKSSFFPDTADSRSEAMKIGNLSVPPTQVPSAEGQAILFLAAPGVDQIAVRGYWYYQDREGGNRPLRDARVEIWDADASGDTLLDTKEVGDDLAYRFEGLPPGTYRVEAIGPCLRRDEIILDEDNPEANVHLSA